MDSLGVASGVCRCVRVCVPVCARACLCVCCVEAYGSAAGSGEEGRQDVLKADPSSWKGVNSRDSAWRQLRARGTTSADYVLRSLLSDCSACMVAVFIEGPRQDRAPTCWQ